MSKNVAVFVDVANIFYAAKAAGVDIDYVTLLKSATAGRDFVRAYAYTGLDPENENQRQFHSFLARSGYKVISKDIRKYGDGRIKANLDIELVVDMMRMAQHIDIAVIVSGDGDFAPAIRAVQQLGVRAEVISFRGNTSSDLIDVADIFTDITQIARVEKGARSGRRVAAEGDLSMTEVPEKETEGMARRRRSRRGERDDQPVERGEVAAVEAGMPGNLIVLPGERLSRVAADGDHEPEAEVAAELDAGDALNVSRQNGETDAEGRRRRRRRGGRGRGRGRQGELDQVGVAAAAGGEPIIEDDEFLDEEIAPLPQHSAFGSVWDSQLGVTPTAPIAAATANVGEEDFEDEPEIPEYLLAERRQQRGRGGRGMRPGQGCGCGGGGRRAGYQAAMDRERYGRSAGSTGGGSGFAGGSLRPDRSRPPMSAGNRGTRPPQARPTRPAYQDLPREQERPSPSAEPWSEVPPDVQELLRAELARRQSTSGQSATAMRSASPMAQPTTPPPAVPRRGRSSRPAAAAEAASSPQTAASEAPTAPVRRGRSAASAAGAGASQGEEPTPSTRTRRPRASASPVASAPEPGTADAGSESAPPKVRRAAAPRTSPRSRAATATPSEVPADAGAPPPASATRRRTTRKGPSEPGTASEA